MANYKQRIIAKILEQELKQKNATVVVDESSCDGCGGCVETCPHAAICIITLNTEQVKKLSFKGRLKTKIKGNNKAHINPHSCTSCGLCMAQCHEYAIHKVKNAS